MLYVARALVNFGLSCAVMGEEARKRLLLREYRVKREERCLVVPSSRNFERRSRCHRQAFRVQWHPPHLEGPREKVVHSFIA